MSALDIFHYGEHQVRTVVIDGDPWFVLADLCRALDIGNPTMTAERVNPDALSSAEVIDSMGRKQTARIVSEPGMYQVIFLSRKPEARQFQWWVTHDVLPTLRKTGRYGSDVDMLAEQPGFADPRAESAGRRQRCPMVKADGGGVLAMLVKEVAANEAEAVLSAHWNGTFPVDVEQIARRLGVSVSRAALPEGTSGMILKRPDEDAHIFVERSDAPQRQRFTTAHELGHFIERTVVQNKPDEDFGFVDRRNAKTHDLHEFFANEFAANLLQPVDEVRRCIAAGMSVVSMAAHFGVSVIALKMRLARLGMLA